MLLDSLPPQHCLVRWVYNMSIASLFRRDKRSVLLSSSNLVTLAIKATILLLFFSKLF